MSHLIIRDFSGHLAEDGSWLAVVRLKTVEDLASKVGSRYKKVLFLQPG